MRIKQLTIENFRSYAGETTFDFIDGLNLIIGSNGDGKTTFFDAVEWLFNTTGTVKMDQKFISKKTLSEMMDGETGQVRVSMTFDHYGEKLVEKSFKFSSDGSVFGYKFDLWEYNGTERQKSDGIRLDIYFPDSIKSHSMFKGESTLNILKKKDTVTYLLNTFSELNKFKLYAQAVEDFANTSDRALNAVISGNRKITKESQELQRRIEEKQRDIDVASRELRSKQKEIVNFDEYLENLEKNKENSQVLKDINTCIANKSKDKATYASRIHDEYTLRLLDEQWVLMGFAPIVEEYSKKIADAAKKRKKEELNFAREQGVKENLVTLHENGVTPLALYIPDEATMRDMLNDHVCKVCNTPAPEGSAAYKFMEMRLHMFLESLKAKHEEAEEEETPFPFRYIDELHKRSIVLNNNMEEYTTLYQKICDDIAFNKRMHTFVSNLSQDIEQLEYDKQKLISQTDGLNEDDLKAVLSSVQTAWRKKSDFERRIATLEEQIRRDNLDLEDLRKKRSAMAKESSASIVEKAHDALVLIANAFQQAMFNSKMDFIKLLESTANKYLDKLNRNDFRGYIRIREAAEDTFKIDLYDTSNTKITNPNTALETTMNMAVLFAVSDISELKRDNDYPLIFDAPTSSFTQAKESDFFNVIDDIQKQTIIVTKSFLLEDEKGNNTLDESRLKGLKGKIYRIEKKKPFDDRDLSTIQTVLTDINL